MTRYEELRGIYQDLRDAGYIPATPSIAECADWAYGTTVIENSSITRSMAIRAAEADASAA